MEFDTIASLATAPAPAGLAVVRISGPDAKIALKNLFISKLSPVEHRREMIFGQLHDPKTNQFIDNILAVYMPKPHSYTGEDIVEFQLHGSPLLVQKVLQTIYALGIRPAEAGEFTKRAFLNGKVDLVQAEAIADLIHASSEKALKIAGEQLRGRFSKSVEEIGEPLRDTLAELEASIDFPEEGIEPKKVEQFLTTFKSAQDKITDLISTYSYGQIVREGFRVLLCGYPNAGKSSILNKLLGTERAIVTDIPGTTRDLIEEQAVISGYKFVFCDTAGLHQTDNKVEQIGIELAKGRLGWADLVLLVVDSSNKSQDWRKISEEIKPKAPRLWMVINKIDLNPNAISEIFCESAICQRNFYISAKSGAGLKALNDAMVEEVSASTANQAESSVVVINERHKNCLERASRSIEAAVLAIKDKMPLEIITFELKSALACLDEIIGKTWNEDILGRIFSKFCIGK